MRHILLSLLIIINLGLFACTDKKTSLKKPAETKIQSQIPEFSLKDPAGKTFSKKSFDNKGLVLVVTAPILSNKNEQKGWVKYLDQTRSGNKAKLVFLEDMGPSSFKGMALSQMKKEYVSGKEPILLIDHEGQLRSKLGVAEKATVVLVYNDAGKLVHKESGGPSAASAEKVWKMVEK